MKIYCMSDIHGYLFEFDYALSLIEEQLEAPDTKLVFLGDYIHGPDSYGVLDRMITLPEKWGGDKVIALRGNHEDMVCDGTWPIGEPRVKSEDGKYDKDGRYIKWMKNLLFYYSEENIIFVHAGIDEELEDMWEWTDEYTCMWKYPVQTGKFYGNLKIVAGHVGTAEIAQDPTFHDIFYDGESHYFIDGTVQESGAIPVLLIDTEANRFYRVTESGAWPVLAYNEY